MALTWLAFFDPASAVGVGQDNQQWDRNLAAFLLLFPYQNNRFAPALPYNPAESWLGVFNGTSQFNEFLTRIEPLIRAMGYTPSSSNGQQIVKPAGENYLSRSTIVALNDLLYRNYPSFLLSPANWPSSGLTQNGIREYLLGNRYSPWMEVQGAQAGARFLLPFYDVTAAVGPGQPNAAEDVMLVRYLLSAIFQLSQFKPAPKSVEDEFRNGPPARATSWASLAYFADKSGAAGVAVSDPQVVRPTGGAAVAGAAIQRLNYWAHKVGTDRFANLITMGLLPGVLPPQALRVALMTNRKSLYFSTGGSR
ncbi:MAG: hypothetical protein U0R19_24745 [Bryobacteraceae bacterium]